MIHPSIITRYGGWIKVKRTGDRPVIRGDYRVSDIEYLTSNREVEQTKLVRVRVRVRQKVVYDVITFCVPRTCATRYTYGKTCKATSTRLRLLVDFISN